MLPSVSRAPITTAIPTVVAVGASASGVAAVVPGLPAGHTTNDILLLFVQSSNQTVAAPAEWTKLGPAVGLGTAAAAGASRLTIFWKRHDGSEVDPTVADTGDHTLAQIMAVRGCATTGDPFVSVGQKCKRTASTTGTARAGATHVANCLVVNAFAHALDSASAVFSSPTNANLTSVTEQIDVATADGTGGGIGVITGGKAAAGSFAATTVTMTSGTDCNSTFYLVPSGTTNAGAIDLQEFVTPGLADTWTKPTGASQVEITAIGGGASGSAGRNAATAAGGGGGGGAGWGQTTHAASSIAATMTVTAGAGGAATANTDGAASNVGAQSIASSGGVTIAYGSAGPAAGASATGSGGAGGAGGGFATAAAAAGVDGYGNQQPGGGTGGTTAGAGGHGRDFAGGAGAGGGTTQAASGGGLSYRGGGGGGGGRSNTNVGTGGASMIGQVAGGATAGAVGADSIYLGYGGSGAAGGTSAAGPGGAGGWPGGGGGGGGSQSGAQRGGAGGDGVVVIVTYC